MARSLADYTADELKAMDYTDLLALRADAYREHVAEMETPKRLTEWAATMTRRYGSLVKIWKNRLPWLEALMVARYGEDPFQWPTAWSEDDIRRAEAWAKGRRHNGQRGSAPHGLEYLDLDDSGFLATGALGLLLVKKVLALLAFFGLGGLASALSNFWENELIDHLFRARSYTAPSAMYIALYTAAPGETGGGTEVSGGSYARVSVAPAYNAWEGTGGETTAADSAGTGGGTQNVGAITFPAPTANWGSVTHFGALDASTSGNLYFYGALTTAKTVNNGDPAPSFAAGALDFSLA